MCKKCDSCGENFTLSHALSCKKGGLIIMRHDEIKDELGDLLSQALTPSAVRDEPSIKPSPTVRNEPKDQNNNNNNSENVVEQHERRGDLLVRGLWKRSKHCVIDVKITDVNQPSYINRCPKKVIEYAEKKQKNKIPRGLSRTEKRLHPLCYISGWTAWKRSQNAYEENFRITS